MILGEEFGEACQDAFSLRNMELTEDEWRAKNEDLYKELIQVAAVAAAWAERVKYGRA